MTAEIEGVPLHLAILTVQMSLGMPDDDLHAPNEILHLLKVRRGIQIAARFLEIAGG